MATDTVTLNEITSVKGDAANSYGSPAGGTDVVLQFNPGIQFLSYAAKAKADADQFKYLQFQQNMKDFYKNWDDINVDGIMEKDYEPINKEYATLAADIARNYDVIRDPMKNREKFEELKQREAQLRGRISQSKQDVAFRDFHKKFIAANPNFNTEPNKGQISQFENNEIGQRKLFNLETPFAYDPAERAKVANSVAQQKLKQEQSAGRYIKSEESVQYLQDEYDRAWDALGAMQDKSGRPIKDAAIDSYKKIYGAQLQGGQSLDDIDRQVGRSLLYQNDFFKTLREDPVAAQEDQQKFQSWQNGLNRSLQRDLARDKELDAAGRDYNEALTSGFSTGYVRPQLLQGVFGDNNEVQVQVKEQVEMTDANGKKLGIFNPTGKETTTKVPKIQVTGSRLDPQTGKLVVTRVDNSTGKPVPMTDIIMEFDEAREAFKNIAGSNNAGKVADAAEEYRKRYKLGLNPELPLLQRHFDFQPGTQPQSAQTPKKIGGL